MKSCLSACLLSAKRTPPPLVTKNLSFFKFRQGFPHLSVRGDQKGCRFSGGFLVPWRICMHQYPWRPIPERQRGGSAPVPLRKKPDPRGYRSEHPPPVFVFHGWFSFQWPYITSVFSRWQREAWTFQMWNTLSILTCQVTLKSMSIASAAQDAWETSVSGGWCSAYFLLWLV